MKAFLATMMLSLTVYQGALPEGSDGFGKDNPEAKHISVVQLLANPDTWHNRTVPVEGVLIFEHEVNALYLGPDDADNRLTKNMGRYSGSIEVSRIHPKGKG